jgi:ribosomal protein L37E
MGGKNMRTLSELGRHGAQLEITCRNCGNSAVFAVLELTNWIGHDADPENLKFRCSRCRSRRFRWSPALGGDGWKRKRPPSPLR